MNILVDSKVAEDVDTISELTTLASQAEVQSQDRELPVVTAVVATVTVPFGGTYTDAGATVRDNSGETLTAVASGNVDVNIAGTYTITYTAIDAAGNEGIATTVVTVSPRFLVGTDTVTDTLTKIVWDKTVSDAASCVAPKVLPTVKQFQSIIDYKKSRPAIIDGFNIDGSDTYYKTSDAWSIRIKYGQVKNDLTYTTTDSNGTKTTHDITKTICVNDTNKTTVTREVLVRDVDTNEVKDPNTGLIWSDSRVMVILNYTDATDTCVANSMRLPTLAELDSIYDRENKKTIESFTQLHGAYHWTSTEYKANPDYNWVVGFLDIAHNGTPGYNPINAGSIHVMKKTNADAKAWFRCVKDAE